jgi:hypothetical protein
MDRMGHDSERAAMIYLHGSDARQQTIADTLSQLARDELNQGSGGKARRSARKGSGTQRARHRREAS